MKQVTTIFLLALMVYATVGTLHRTKVSRLELGITKTEEHRCAAPKLPTYEQRTYDMSTAANDYMLYAVATLNAYGPQQTNEITTKFTVDKHSPEWSWVEKLDYGNGLALDIYRKETSDQLTVLTVFRGTETFDTADWLANFSWFLGWLPIKTQYDQARAAFRRDVRQPAFSQARGKKISFITAGHSLGGGLAQHVAYAFPCVGAVVFNASFVINRYQLAHPYHQAPVVHLYEDRDELTQLRRILLGEADTEYYKHYELNAVPGVDGTYVYQHSMEDLAVGMAREIVRCQFEWSGCVVPRRDLRALRLYCGSVFQQRENRLARLCRKTGRRLTSS